MILLILIINTLAFLAWGKYLEYLDAFTVDKNNVQKVFWFVTIGSVFCMILVSILYPLWENILYSITGLYYNMNPFVSNFLIVGPVEELTKFLVFIFLAGIFNSIKEPRDGILQAASVALGFALFENFLYAIDTGILNLLYRSFFATLGHMTYSVIWGFAWGATAYTTTGKNKSTDRHYIIPALVTTIIFHGAYNTLLRFDHPWIAFLTDIITLIIFFFIYRFVKDNSPYRAYRLDEYRSAIPSIKMGLLKYPDSYVLNKRMGIYYIYIKKYKNAVKYLRKSKNIRPKSASARFYFGAARYLNRETEKGINEMNSSMMYLTAEKREKIVASLNKIVTDEDEKEDLIGRYNLDRTLFETEEERPRPDSKDSKLEPLTIPVENWGYARKVGVSSGINRDEILLGKKERKRIKLRKQGRNRGSYLDDFDNRGTWERLIKERPGPVLLKPYYLKKGESVVTNLGKSKKK